MDNTDVELLKQQLKAIAIYKYLEEYNKLEKSIKMKFKNILNLIAPDDIHRLYFYHGGTIKNTEIDFSNETIKLNELKFKCLEKEPFNNFTINQIIKLHKEHGLGEYFNLQIQSIKTKGTKHDFSSAISKLINMRNILAHEVSDFNFKDRDYIELLSNELIINNIDTSLYGDITQADDQVKMILSNIAYLQIIRNEIENCLSNSVDKKV